MQSGAKPCTQHASSYKIQNTAKVTPRDIQLAINSSSEKRLLLSPLDHISLDLLVVLLSSLVFVAPLNLVLSFQIDGLFSEGSANL